MFTTEVNDKWFSEILQPVTCQWIDVIHSGFKVLDESTRCQPMQSLDIKKERCDLV